MAMSAGQQDRIDLHIHVNVPPAQTREQVDLPIARLDAFHHHRVENAFAQFGIEHTAAPAGGMKCTSRYSLPLRAYFLKSS